MADRPVYPRIPCLVPGCRCGSRRFPPAPGREYICAKHWRLVDKSLKLTRSRGRRRGKGERFDRLVWMRMRRQAIERAAGL